MSTQVIGRRIRTLRLAAVGTVAGLLGLGVWLPLTDTAEAATNSNLTLAPSSGSSISGNIIFSAPAPGCGTVPQAVVRMKGPGITGDLPDDTGFVNITGALVLETPSAALSLSSDGNTWDNIAINKSIPRPLNGVYTVKIQCVEDGASAGKAFFDRDVTFTGSSQTWAIAGGGVNATPTPTPLGTPTPTPAPTGAATPTPEATVEPTPEPEAECDDTVEDCSETTDDETDEESEEAGGDKLPNSGGQSPNDYITLAVLLFISGAMLLFFAFEPRWLRSNGDGDTAP